MKKCSNCGKESEFLLPIKTVSKLEIKEEKVCSECYESLLKAYGKDMKEGKIHSLTTPQFHEGICKACGETSKYLRKALLEHGKAKREVPLCPICYEDLRALLEYGETYEKLEKVTITL